MQGKTNTLQQQKPNFPPGLTVKQTDTHTHTHRQAHKYTHLYWQDVYVEADEPSGNHQGPHYIMIHHGLPDSGDFNFHQFPQHFLVRRQSQHGWTVVVCKDTHKHTHTHTTVSLPGVSLSIIILSSDAHLHTHLSWVNSCIHTHTHTHTHTW